MRGREVLQRKEGRVGGQQGGVWWNCGQTRQPRFRARWPRHGGHNAFAHAEEGRHRLVQTPERHSGVQRGKGFLHVAAGTATRGGRGQFHLCTRCCVTTGLREQALSSPLLSRSHFMLTLIHFLRKEQHVAFCVSFSHPTCHFFASLSQAELW